MYAVVLAIQLRRRERELPALAPAIVGGGSACLEAILVGTLGFPLIAVTEPLSIIGTVAALAIIHGHGGSRASSIVTVVAGVVLAIGSEAVGMYPMTPDGPRWLWDLAMVLLALGGIAICVAVAFALIRVKRAGDRSSMGVDQRRITRLVESRS